MYRWYGFLSFLQILIGIAIVDDANGTVSPEGILSINPENITLSQRGENASFACYTDAPDTEYLWLHNISNLVCTESDCSDGIFVFNATTQEIAAAIIPNTITLDVVNANAPEHGGEYVCAAVNSAGIEISISTLNFLPEFIEMPVDTEINSLSDNVTLTCRAESFPFPTYQWQKKISGEFVNIVNETGEMFVETDVEHNDAGVYRCVVTNIINGVTNTIMSMPATVHVTPNNTVTLTVDGSGNFVGHNLYIDQGGDFEISCMAAGGPNNKHIWKQEGTTINSGSNFNISSSVNDTMSISILSVNSVDAAIHKGSYSCEVMNDAGEHYNGLIIHVSPLGIVSITPQVQRGGGVSFNCSSDAGPSNEYVWLYKPTDLVCSNNNCSDNNFSFNISNEEMNQTVVGSEEKLFIDSISDPMHRGEYVCIIMNHAGIGIATINVTEIHVPDTPSFEDLSSSSVSMKWKPPVDPNGDIISYNIRVDPLRFMSDPFAPSKRRRQIADNVAKCYQHLNLTYPIELTVFGLTVNMSLLPFINYQASVSANAVFGSGNFSSYMSFTTPEDVRGVIINLMGTTHSATSVVLAWDAPPCPNGPIAGYYVYYRQANNTQSLPIDSSQYTSSKNLSTDLSISTIIYNLTPGESYCFHVRAFNNESEPGLVDHEICMVLNEADAAQAGYSVAGLVVGLLLVLCCIFVVFICYVVYRKRRGNCALAETQESKTRDQETMMKDVAVKDVADQ